ncbi:hypothetical protein N7535_007724 [Penicillium sp. DV-2018c]|nr:hypothetical protein N7461_003755 [Penicillium sp. DV-2018c]KAJ5566086.1 hypothetical protein N7535_007724 [Penicillium sp. DV-2018c]
MASGGATAKDAQLQLVAKRRRQAQTMGNGEIVWTCAQGPSNNKCSFFLWANEATMREQATVLSNSRSEPDPLYSTPTKQTRPNNCLMTPQTERKFMNTPQRDVNSPPKTAKALMISEASDDYGWDDDLDESVDLAHALASSPSQTNPSQTTSSRTESFISQPNFHPESPSKTPRTANITSPGKRKLSDVVEDALHDPPELATPFSSQSSRTRMFPPSSAEVCLTPTPSKYKDVLSTDSKFNTSDLAHSLLEIMEKHNVVLPNHARDEVVTLLNRHDLKTQGIIRGRDISRLAAKKKDDGIKALQDRVADLEAQRELVRSLVDGMKNSQNSQSSQSSQCSQNSQ